jgi:hypothetical protein
MSRGPSLDDALLFPRADPHANGVIQNSPGSDREAVATPGIDAIARELQGSSTNRPDHLEAAAPHPVPLGGFSTVGRTHFGVLAHLPSTQGGNTCLALPPWLLYLTPLASEHSGVATSARYESSPFIGTSPTLPTRHPSAPNPLAHQAMPKASQKVARGRASLTSPAPGFPRN